MFSAQDFGIQTQDQDNDETFSPDPLKKEKRDLKMKKARLSMRVALFGAKRNDSIISTATGEPRVQECPIFSSTINLGDESEEEEEEDCCNDRKLTRERSQSLGNVPPQTHLVNPQQISVSTFKIQAEAELVKNEDKLVFSSSDDDSQCSFPKDDRIDEVESNQLHEEASPKIALDSFNPNYPDKNDLDDEEEDKGGNGFMGTSYGNYTPPLFSRSIESEAQELKEELQVENDQNIIFIKGDFSNYYEEGKILGEGMSGTVKKCTRKGTNDHFAVKIVRYRGDTELLYLIVNEFKNHRNLNHKNIIKVYELYIDYVTKRIYTIMELAECKEMFETMQDLGNYSEAVASDIFKQILNGINYLHLNGVCHRDLKPHNILVSTDAKIVKITDFNVSKFSEKKNKYTGLSTQNYKMWTHTGTIAFTAPEVFTDSEYTEAVDMWSAGVVLYTMLCGYQPFEAETVPELIELIKQAKYEFHPDPWDSISSEAKDLIRNLLNVDCKARYSPFQALADPWVANHGKASRKSIHGVIENLWAYLNRDNEEEADDKDQEVHTESGSPKKRQIAPKAKTYQGRDRYKHLRNRKFTVLPQKPKEHLNVDSTHDKDSEGNEQLKKFESSESIANFTIEKSLSFGVPEGQPRLVRIIEMETGKGQEQEQMKRRGKDYSKTYIKENILYVGEIIHEDMDEIGENETK